MVREDLMGRIADLAKPTKAQLARDIGDGRVLRLVLAFLKAGLMQNGVCRKREEGTPLYHRLKWTTADSPEAQGEDEGEAERADGMNLIETARCQQPTRLVV